MTNLQRLLRHPACRLSVQLVTFVEHTLRVSSRYGTRFSATARPSFRSIGSEGAPTIAKALDCGEQLLQDLPRGRAFFRTLLNNSPTSAMRLETGKDGVADGKASDQWQDYESKLFPTS